MTLTMQEVSILFNAVNFAEGQKARFFPAAQLPDINGVMGKIRALLPKDSESLPPGDYSLDLERSEKTLILNCLNDRGWPAGDAGTVIVLKEKLEKKDEEKKT